MRDYVTTPRERRLRDARIAQLARIAAPNDAECREYHQLVAARDQWARGLRRRISDARTRLTFLLRDAERFGVDLETTR